MPLSAVWKHFEKLTSSTVKCKVCATVLRFAGGSTGSMLNHLKGRHSLLSEDEDKCKAKSSSIANHFLKHQTCDPARAQKITTLIAEWVATDMLPFYVVEAAGFLKLMEFLAPGFKVPTRKTIKAHCAKLHDEVKEAVKQELSQAEYASVTTDLWTSMANESYMTVTSHFISKPDWTLKSYVLTTHEVDEKHTADELASQLQGVLNDWDLSEKVSAVVHDNGSNVKSIGEDCNTQDVGCAAHTLQLCIDAGLQDQTIFKLQASASRLAGHFRRSPTAMSALGKKQASMDKKKHSLKQSCKTRWNSVLFMLERLTEQRWPVSAVLSDRTYTKLADARTLEMRDEQWSLAESLIPVLKPLQIATTLLGAENNISASVVLPIMCGLLANHLKVANSDVAAIKNFKRVVSGEISRRFFTAGASSIQVVASVLDPRYKALTFTNDMKTFNRNESYEFVESQVKYVCDISSSKRPRMDSPDNDCAGATISSGQASQPDKSAMAFLLGLASNSEVLGETNATKQSEVKRYLNERAQAVDENPLKWWKENACLFPAVSKLALQYLCIPATSVPAERVFSCAGHIVSKKRSALTPKSVNMLVFLASNLKKEVGNHMPV